MIYLCLSNNNTDNKYSVLDDLYAYLNIDILQEIYSNKIENKSAKGLDKISPLDFKKISRNQFTIIIKKCSNSTYNFTPYLELLKLKGNNKIPRVISIPTVRDRIVLLILKNILHKEFKENIRKSLPNYYISQLKRYCKKNNAEFFYQTDIDNFYGSIDNNILIKKLKLRISDTNTLNLIKKAITNPTVPATYRRSERATYCRQKGIPQGTSISNILAEIYLADFDASINTKRYCYLRFVDDIILLRNSQISNYQIRTLKKSLLNINLDLNKKKTFKGTLYDGIIYLGYHIKMREGRLLVTICDRNVQNFIKRIANEFTSFKKNGFPKWSSEEDYSIAFIENLNEIISGAKAENKKYGWIAHFIEITDISLLFRLDGIVKTFFSKIEFFKKHEPLGVKSFVKTSEY